MLRLRTVCSLFLLIFLGAMALATPRELEIVFVGVDGDAQAYRVDIGESQLEAARANTQAFAEQVMHAYSATLEHDIRRGVLDGKFALLTLSAVISTNDANFVLGEVVLLLGRLGRHFSKSTGVPLQFQSTTLFNESAPRIQVRELSDEQRKYLDVAENLWRTIADLSEKKYGSALKADELVNFAIREAIYDSNRPIDDTVVAVGVWMGEQLISGGDFKWASVTDEWGTDIAVVSIESDPNFPTSFFPFSAVRKRLEEGVEFDPREFIDAIINHLDSL